MSFHNSRRIEKTRKSHVCIWCGERTETGMPCLKEAGQWEGDFWSGYMHIECGMARDAVSKKERGWSCEGEYARGRTDDLRNQTSEFSPLGERNQ